MSAARYTFTKTPDPENEHDISTVTISFEATTLDDMCEMFNDFLCAVGFQVQDNPVTRTDLEEGL